MMNTKNKNKKEITSIIESFMTALIICVCLTILATGITISANNTEHLSTGISQAEIYASAESNMISVSVDKSVYEAKLPNKFGLSFILSLAPQPISGFYWIYDNITELIKLL